ncbi:hypothetical protein YM304_33830 [Ilumatobacter coccineus YM16-304]|uniref:Uncharacterized protein n=2 Tax=Ilumatobacter coccineus TaxID=467094 RepID=A0A6C7EAE1_ILUCY|nr:hypothetical protein YM304_33830 [Ilumatobacter coccineus YM16-304]
MHNDGVMTPEDTITTIAGPTGNIGAAFYFDPKTVAAGKELGLDGFRFYVLGRAGVLGDVSAAVVSSAFGYFHPSLIDKIYNSAKQTIDPLTCAQAYFDECGKRGAEHFAGLDGLEAYIEAADVVISAASPAGLPLFAGISGMNCADEPAACAMQKAAVLRELRGSAHLCAVLANGLTDAQAHAIKRPGDVAMFGWEEAPAVPIDGDERMAAAEEATNTMLLNAFFPLSEAQSEALVAGTRAMAAALGV